MKSVLKDVMDTSDRLSPMDKAVAAALLLAGAGITEATVSKFGEMLGYQGREDLVEFLQDVQDEDYD